MLNKCLKQIKKLQRKISIKTTYSNIKRFVFLLSYNSDFQPADGGPRGRNVKIKILQQK